MNHTFCAVIIAATSFAIVFGYSSSYENVTSQSSYPLSTVNVFASDTVTLRDCSDKLVMITKMRGETTACVKPTSVYPLLQRGWASSEHTDTERISLKVAKWFVKDSPTFSFDGIENTIYFEVVSVRESFPQQYVIEANFDSRHSGYGNREGKMLAQVITPHTMRIVVSGGTVVSAITDQKWDELNEKPWKKHMLPDVNPEQTQNSDVFTEGKYEVVTDSNVQYHNGTTGYLAKPKQDKSSMASTFPGIIMIHEWWGLNENIEQMARKLASHGYIVLAVDLFNGNVATTSKEATILVSNYDLKQGTANMHSAVEYLRSEHGVQKIGSLGWCFGGGQSLNFALNAKERMEEELDATVIYYGRLVTDKDQLSSISWPVLGIFAELDQSIKTKEVREFEKKLDELGVKNEIHVYPGVNHAFTNPTGKSYAPQESADAWQKTIMFLDTTLKK